MKTTLRTWALLAVSVAAIATACSTSESDKPTVNLSGGDSGQSTGGSATLGGASPGGATNATAVGGAANPLGAGGINNAPATGGAGNTSAAAGAVNNPSVAGNSSVGGSGAVTVAGAPGTGGSSGVVDCFDAAKKCYTCTSSNKALLNQCTDAACIPYDNKTLKKLNADGSVPALPYPI